MRTRAAPLREGSDRGARGLRWNPETLEDAASVAHVHNRSDDPRPAMALGALQNVDAERTAQKQGPREPGRGRVEQAAEKARPMADAKDVRRETLDLGKPSGGGHAPYRQRRSRPRSSPASIRTPACRLKPSRSTAKAERATPTSPASLERPSASSSSLAGNIASVPRYMAIAAHPSSAADRCARSHHLLLGVGGRLERTATTKVRRHPVARPLEHARHVARRQVRQRAELRIVTPLPVRPIRAVEKHRVPSTVLTNRRVNAESSTNRGSAIPSAPSSTAP
jgi:hypothetical protein